MPVKINGNKTDLALLYSSDDFHLSTSAVHSQSDRSSFDHLFLDQWEEARAEGAFNYSVDGVQTKVLPGKYGIVAQMNTYRKTLRRAPEEILNVQQPFNPHKFNFTKIKKNEHLLQLVYVPGASQMSGPSGVVEEPVTGSVMINTAPICSSHSLLVPSVSQCLQQVATSAGLTLALHSILLSNTPDLRVAFNSLGGYASVNHLHFHLYYLPYTLPIETAECDQLVGSCYTFREYYAPAFVFQLENGDVDHLARQVMKVVKLFLSEGIAHNLFMTRGKSLGGGGSEKDYSTIRVILWAREFCSGVKDVGMFATAVCELAGHVPVYSAEGWEKLTEDQVTHLTTSVCREVYTAVKPKVAALFSQEDENGVV